MNPDWWKSLSEGTRKSLARRMTTFVDLDIELPRAHRVNDDLVVPPWTIMGRYEIQPPLSAV